MLWWEAAHAALRTGGGAEAVNTAPDVLLTVKEYAEMFQVTTRSVYLAIKEGHLPYPVVRPLGRSPRILVPSELASRLRAA